MQSDMDFQIITLVAMLGMDCGGREGKDTDMWIFSVIKRRDDGGLNLGGEIRGARILSIF